MADREDPLAHLVPRDGLRDVDILLLDALAVAGGSASREQLFHLIDRKLWGHMAGEDKQQTFDTAVERLLQQQAIVPWGDDRAPALALPPRPYELPPRLPGGKPYVPGTEHWNGERQLLLSEVHRQLAVHLEETARHRAKFLEHFEPERAKLLALVKRQIERRQIDASARAEILVALSKLWLAPVEIAAHLELREVDVNAALNPNPPARRGRKPADRQGHPAALPVEPAIPMIKAAGGPPEPAISTTDGGIAPTDPVPLALERLVQLVRSRGGELVRGRVSKYLHLSPAEADSLIELYAQTYPSCVEYRESANHHYTTVIHAPQDDNDS